MLNQIAKQCSVRFIATCTFGGTYQVETAIKPSRGKEVIVDIGNDGQAETASQNVERLRNVRIEVELGKGFESAPDRLLCQNEQKPRVTIVRKCPCMHDRAPSSARYFFPPSIPRML